MDQTNAAETSGRQRAMDDLFDACFRQNLETICLELADFGISQDRIDLLLSVYLKCAPEVFADKATGVIKICFGLAKKGASKPMIETLIAKYLDLGAKDLVAHIGREFTVDEIKGMHKHIPRWAAEEKEFRDGMQKINSLLGDLNKDIDGIVNKKEKPR